MKDQPFPNNKSWECPVPARRLDFGHKPLHFETTFWELRPGRLAPINTRTAVGVPGWPVIGFGYLMRARYSEFEMRFSALGKDGEERSPHILSNFHQVSPADWLPGVVSEWDDDGVHYRVSYIVVPNDLQPMDLYQILLKNPTAREVRGNLLVTLNGASTLAAKNDLIAAQGKPLLVMDPRVRVQRIARPTGCVDPRATSSGTWGSGSPHIDEWRTHRTGWYGMPIEYLLQVAPGQSQQLFLGFDDSPIMRECCWDTAEENIDPEILALNKDKGQEVVATVEGDPASQQISLPPAQRTILRFVGRDTDGDGYIRVSVRATPESRQPAVLAVLWAFGLEVQISTDDLLAGQGEERSHCRIDVGDDMPWDIEREWRHIGADPTAFALRLHYRPTLAPGEERTYLLRLPAIDKPEAAPYGQPWRPYDTGETWKPCQ